MNGEVKNALMSKTVWGAILAIVATGAKIAGFDIGDPELYVNDILAIVGAVFAVYGRTKATAKITVM